MDSLQDGAARVEALAGLSKFRREFYGCLTSRADALFELADAVLCATGPVVSLPELSLEPVHRRGHGAMYDALAQGHIAVSRFQMVLAGLALPRGADGQLSIALDVTAWPRPDAECSPERLHCHRLRGHAFSGQVSDCLFHAAIRNFSYSAWTSRGGR